MPKTESPRIVYVLDTHALYWYWTEPDRLGPAAESAFRALERRKALGLVPVLVVAEVHYLTAKRGMALPVATVLRLLDRAPALRLEGLTRQHLRAFGRLTEIPEMHDRLIAAVGLLHDATVVTRDPDIQAHRVGSPPLPSSRSTFVQTSVKHGFGLLFVLR